MLVGQDIQNTQDLLQDSNSMIGIDNGIIFLIQCRFHHIDHLYLCHADPITVCLVFYTSWYYNSCMPSLPRYLFPDYITYREPAIGKPSPTINDRFDEKDRPIQKKKYKVIKQVYRVKKMND